MRRIPLPPAVLVVCALAAVLSACARPCDDARREAAGALTGYHADAVAAATAGALVAASGTHQVAGDRRQIEDAPVVAELVEQMQSAVLASDWSAVEAALDRMGELATAPGWSVAEPALRRAIDVCNAR